MKFRKRPVIIEAEQFKPEVKPWHTGVEQYVKESKEDIQGYKSTWYAWRIDTLEGVHEVSPMDWIITGVKGEKYACKPDIFEMTYEYVINPSPDKVSESLEEEK